MPETGNLRSFWITVAVFNVILSAAGAVYAGLENVPVGTAVPIVAAFLIQATVYLVAGFPAARARLTAELSPDQLALALALVSTAPHLVYTIPLGLFDLESALEIFALCVVAAYLYVLFPTKSRSLTWQDALLIGLLVTPVISGLTTFFREAYPAPGGAIERLDILGKLMVIPLGAIALLCLRGLEGADYRLWPRRRDLWIGAKYYLLFLPVGIPLALATGFLRFEPRDFAEWRVWGELVGKGLGIFLVTALSEELCFRGTLQNLLTGSLRNGRAAQAVAAVLFGAVHLSFRDFPNYPFAITAAAAGWFYGEAYRAGAGVVPAAVCHTLTVLTWTFVFR